MVGIERLIHSRQPLVRLLLAIGQLLAGHIANRSLERHGQPVGRRRPICFKRRQLVHVHVQRTRHLVERNTQRLRDNETVGAITRVQLCAMRSVVLHGVQEHGSFVIIGLFNDLDLRIVTQELQVCFDAMEAVDDTFRFLVDDDRRKFRSRRQGVDQVRDVVGVDVISRIQAKIQDQLRC